MPVTNAAPSKKAIVSQNNAKTQNKTQTQSGRKGQSKKKGRKSNKNASTIKYGDVVSLGQARALSNFSKEKVGDMSLVNLDPLIQVEQEQVIKCRDSSNMSFKAKSVLTRDAYQSAVSTDDGDKVYRVEWVTPSRHLNGDFDRRGNPRTYTSARCTLKNITAETIHVDCTSPRSDPGNPSLPTARANFGTRVLKPGGVTTYTVKWSGRPMNYPLMSKRVVKDVKDGDHGVTTIELFNFFFVRENINEYTNDALNENANVLDISLEVSYEISSVFPPKFVIAEDIPEFIVTHLGSFTEMYTRYPNNAGPLRSTREIYPVLDLGLKTSDGSDKFGINKKDFSGTEEYYMIFPTQDIHNKFVKFYDIGDGDSIFFPTIGICFFYNKANDAFRGTNGPYSTTKIRPGTKDWLLGLTPGAKDNWSFNEPLYIYEQGIRKLPTDEEVRIDLTKVIAWMTAATKVLGIVAAVL